MSSGPGQTVDSGLFFFVISLFSEGVVKEGLFYIPIVAQSEHGSKFRGGGSPH